QGWVTMYRRRQTASTPWLLLLLSAALGCGETAPRGSEPPADPAASRFDPATAGTIQGRVTWQGMVPRVAPSQIWTDPAPAGGPRRFEPNVNAPAVDEATRGVANAVVFLRGVDPAQARP